MLSRKLFINLFVLFAVLAITVAPSLGATAHPLSEESLIKGLPDKLETHWRAITPSRKLTADEIAANTDANLLNEYGLQTILDRQYSDGKTKLRLTAFEMKYVSGAYGFWTLQRGTTDVRYVFDGRFVLRLAGSDQAAVDALTAQLQTELSSAAEPPLLPTYLPEQSKISNSEKYLVGPEGIGRIAPISDLKNAIDFTGGTHAALADYNHGNGKMSVLLVEFQSPQFAIDGLAKMQSHFNSLSQEEQKKRILRRVGNYAVEAVNVSDTKAAEELLKQIKYMVTVHWEGKDVSDIPLPFRPPDPAALREVIQTGHFIVAAFYWIGVLLVSTVATGIFAGGAFFYWRRAQRRKLGLEDGFTDAGGMTRLNLDDYLLSGSDSATKLLGKGK